MFNRLSRLPGTKVAFAAGLAVACAGEAAASPRCAKFGSAAYQADKTTTVGGRTLSSRIYISGAQSREETRAPDGTTDVTIMSPNGGTLFSPERKVGVRLPAPRKPPLDREGGRVREEPAEGGVALIVELKDGDAWREVDRTVCRRDGVMLQSRGLSVVGGKQGTTETRLSNIQVGGIDASLFRVPADVKIATPPKRQ